MDRLVAPHIRPLDFSDFRTVLQIENEAFEFPWSWEEFADCLQDTSDVSLVIENQPHGCVVGYAIYCDNYPIRYIKTIAVDTAWRFQGFGRELVNVITNDAWRNSYATLSTLIRETNIAGQFFWQSLEFKRVATVLEPYEETTEAGYLMIRRQWEKDPSLHHWFSPTH